MLLSWFDFPSHSISLSLSPSFSPSRKSWCSLNLWQMMIFSSVILIFICLNPYFRAPDEDTTDDVITRTSITQKKQHDTIQQDNFELKWSFDPMNIFGNFFRRLRRNCNSRVQLTQADVNCHRILSWEEEIRNRKLRVNSFQVDSRVVHHDNKYSCDF